MENSIGLKRVNKIDLSTYIYNQLYQLIPHYLFSSSQHHRRIYNGLSLMEHSIGLKRVNKIVISTYIYNQFYQLIPHYLFSSSQHHHRIYTLSAISDPGRNQ